MKTYKVYALKERVSNNIVYIGITSGTLHKRFMDHVRKKKFSPKDYYIAPIQEDMDVLEAATLERMLIAQYDLINKGWNKSPSSINGHSQLHSEYQKALWSKQRKGKPFKGRQNRTTPNSKEHNDKIRQANSKPVICLNDGKTYPSARQAARAYRLKEPRVSDVLSGKRPHTKGYKFSRL